jgi:hypothetical protein
MRKVFALCLVLCMVCFVVSLASAWDDKEATVKGWISDDKCGAKGANAGARGSLHEEVPGRRGEDGSGD